MLYKIKILSLFAGIVGSISVFAADYIYPMKIPVSLSANFGELRPNHFHSGIDFRTQKREGIPVYAVADGYVSRVGVLSWGYGNALYLTHKDGVTSVYAHLQKFIPAIEQWVRTRQYSNEAFILDESIEPRMFPVKQGDLIGYSGNSGHSMGPHLHFELRNANQMPFNPISRNIYKVADNIPPHVRRLYVYQLNYTESTFIRTMQANYPLRLHGNTYRIVGGDTIEVADDAIFGLDMNDHKNASQSTFGVYSAQIWCNGSLVFEWSIDHFSFNETRYVNAAIDFDAYSHIHRYVTMLYRAPGNALNIYGNQSTTGILRLPKGSKIPIEIKMTDDAGNVSKVTFWAKNVGNIYNSELPAYSKMLYYHKTNIVSDGYFKLIAPRGCLYESCCLMATMQDSEFPGALTSLYSLSCLPSTPPHSNMIVGIRASIPEYVWDKVVMIGKNGRGKRAVRNGDFWIANAREWGTYALAIDTTPPQIKYVHPRSDKSNKTNLVRFRISDNMTSIKQYKGYIDGAWALFEMDSKQNVIFYRIDYSRVSRNKWHKVRITAEDEMGNTAENTYEIYF